MSSFYILWIIYISSSREYFLSKQRGQICLKHFFLILLWMIKERERKEMRWKIFWQTMHTHCTCISFPCKNIGTEKRRANKEKSKAIISIRWNEKESGYSDRFTIFLVFLLASPRTINTYCRYFKVQKEKENMYYQRNIVNI